KAARKPPSRSACAKFQALLTICWDALLMVQRIVESRGILFHKSGQRFQYLRRLRRPFALS
ncbi:MAG: hypothetical protein ACT4P8_20275, partial [Betaproteobacteria bacterium]